MKALAHIDIVRDEERPVAARRRALRVLERTERKHRGEVARHLTPALSAAPDLAGEVHVALLVLDPDLAVGRDDSGRFVAAALPLRACADDGVGGRVDAAIGRVVGLDALARLFQAEEAMPAFLAPPERPAPAPYRPPPEVLEARRLEAAFVDAQRLRREKLAILGLEPEDLDDDPPLKPARVARHKAPIVAYVDDDRPAAITVGAASAERRVELGRAHPGAWWAAERSGDHRGARRFHLRLDRNAPPERAAVRRERSLPGGDGPVELTLGTVHIERDLDGRGAVVWVEEEDGLVVAVTLTWSSWGALRASESKPGPTAPARGSR